MAKTIIKELIIALLLCLAIILILGILLYEYVPIAKTIPNTVSYTTPEDVKQELLTAESIDENKVILTYEVDTTDLNNYKKINDYKPGKANPFSTYVVTENTENSEQTNTTGTTNNSGSSNSNNTTSSNGSQNTTNNNSGATDNTTSSGGYYFKDKGTK